MTSRQRHVSLGSPSASVLPARLCPRLPLLQLHSVPPPRAGHMASCTGCLLLVSKHNKPLHPHRNPGGTRLLLPRPSNRSAALLPSPPAFSSGSAPLPLALAGPARRPLPRSCSERGTPAPVTPRLPHAPPALPRQHGPVSGLHLLSDAFQTQASRPRGLGALGLHFHLLAG